MAIILPHGLVSEEFRLLQEFRRLNAQTLSLEKVKAIKHPSGREGVSPANSLVSKGWLEAGETRESFTLTQKARDLLAIDVRPMFEEAGAPAPAPATEGP